MKTQGKRYGQRADRHATKVALNNQSVPLPGPLPEGGGEHKPAAFQEGDELKGEISDQCFSSFSNQSRPKGAMAGIAKGSYWDLGEMPLPPS